MNVQPPAPSAYVVRRTRSKATGRVSYTVLGPDKRPVEPIERHLGWLHNTERSPNTIHA